VAATVDQLALLVRGRVVGDGTLPIQAAKPISEAGPGDITFLDDERYSKSIRSSPPSAMLVGPHFRLPEGPARPAAMIEVDDPRGAFLEVHSHLKSNGRSRWSGVHATASIAESAQIGRGVAIHPLVFIGEDVVIGDGCTLYPGVHIGDRCRLGANVVLHPNVVLYHEVALGDRVEVHGGTVIGADGFGYRQVEGQHIKIPQTGGVEIGDDVEIGSNCTIDRGTFDSTRIGTGTKIDNLVMIGHNCQIGQHNILCGQVGIAGSCKTGDYVVMAGQAGIKDHTQIGDRAVVGAQAGVHRSIPAGQHVLGSPAIPVKEQRHVFAMIARLPEMHKHLRELAQQVALLSLALPPAPNVPAEEDPTGI
jgi:UDP-3-O-[3-hydroxymyristoyl] glucosamine N-acyltransferase